MKCRLIALLCCVFSQALSAAETATGLDLFLEQAFAVKRVEEREAILHIGIQGEAVSEGFLVSAVLESYPAHRAGIRRGDIILSADGAAFDPVESLNKNTNPRIQDSHLLDIKRGGQELEITVSPVKENLFDSFRNASLQSVLEFSRGNKVIGYLRLWGLSRNTADLLSYEQMIGGLDHCDGIILDLRDSYGFADPSLRSLFIPASLTSDAYRKPLAILINQRTRGGGESLTADLDHLERIVSIGDATAGESARLDFQAHEPEFQLPFPASESRRDDPQFETAVQILMGII
jgi:C-terminal processing protease CtpA/Prc